MRSLKASWMLALVGVALCGLSPILGPSVHADPPPTQEPATAAAEESEPAEGAVPPPQGPAPVNGVITYTYYVGTTPNGKPLPGPPVNAGTYTVVASFRSADGNYTGGSACTTFTIQKATPFINLQHRGGTYTGAPLPASGAVLTGRPGATPPRVEVDEAGVPIMSEAMPADPRQLPRSLPARTPAHQATEIPRLDADTAPPIANPRKPTTKPALPGKPMPQASSGADAGPTIPTLPPKENPQANAATAEHHAPATPKEEPLASPTVSSEDTGNPYFTGQGTVVWPPRMLDSTTNTGDTRLITEPPNPHGDECAAGPRFWFSGEYLMWFIKGSPLPFPLVTSSTTPGTNVSGALGQPGTSILYGGHDADFGMFSGMRLNGGVWIDNEERFGVEGEIFFLQSNTASFNTASNTAGSPSLYLPAFNMQLAAERALIVADPTNALAGNVAISSSSQLWGAGVTGLANLLRNSSTSIDLLCGFRYLDLSEGFSLGNTTTGPTGIVDTLRDGFDTTNQFYGASLGSRLTYEHGPFVLSVAEKVALGSTHEVVRVTGGVTESGVLAPSLGTFPGGFFAQPTNIGVRASNPFSIVPELQLRTGYRIRSYLTAFITYDFIYWTNVARPGDQIDRNVNLSQSPIFGATGGVLVGTASPRPLFNRSDFWAQGVSLGLSLRY